MYLSNEGILMILPYCRLAGWQNRAGDGHRPDRRYGDRHSRRVHRELAFTATRHRPRLRADSGDHQCHHRRGSIADNYPTRSSITATSVGVSFAVGAPSGLFYTGRRIICGVTVIT